jgi:hypothetical protein
MIVEYGAGLAESRVALRTVFSDIFDDAQDASRQDEAQTQKHQQGNHDIHGAYSNWNRAAILELP